MPGQAARMPHAACRLPCRRPWLKHPGTRAGARAVPPAGVAVPARRAAIIGVLMYGLTHAQTARQEACTGTRRDTLYCHGECLQAWSAWRQRRPISLAAAAARPDKAATIV